MLTLLRLTQIFRNLIQTTFNWCIKIEALFFHCKNNIEGHIEGISENDMKKRQIWRRRKKCSNKREMAKHGGVGARHLLGGGLGSKRKEWWGFCSLRKDTSQRMAIFSLSLVGAPFNLNGGNAWQYIYMWQNIWQYIFSGGRQPWWWVLAFYACSCSFICNPCNAYKSAAGDGWNNRQLQSTRIVSMSCFSENLQNAFHKEELAHLQRIVLVVAAFDYQTSQPSTMHCNVTGGW